MIYSDYKGKKISRLGFGMMRLPVNEDKSINEEETARIVDYAIKHGVNYFDTAHPYHGGNSEIVVGKILKNYPRDSFYLATKYPGHQIAEEYHPEEIFEGQLKKCGVDYFDFYLLHNVTESSIGVYKDPKWGIIDYFLEQKRLGRIKHLGFSCHGKPECLKEFLDFCGDKMEFCQIQLNYLDWTLQDAKQKCEILNKYNVPIWVMEPVRGGRLATHSDNATAWLKSLRPNDSIPRWAFRWVNDIPGVTVILSGMSNMDQVVDNCETFEKPISITNEEKEVLLSIAEGLKNSLPCTECRYCCDGCPKGIDIPYLIHISNELRYCLNGGFTPIMQYEAISVDKNASACIGCGACKQICPQQIDIPKAMKELEETIKKVPSWKEICKEREEAAKKLK